jgi:hypothetical protein
MIRLTVRSSRTFSRNVAGAVFGAVKLKLTKIPAG